MPIQNGVSVNYVHNVSHRQELPVVNGMNYLEGLQKVYGEAPVKQAVQNIFQAEDKGDMPAFKGRLINALADEKPCLNGADQKYLANYVQRISLGV